MTTIMSRLIFGLSKREGLAALVENAEQDRREHDADRVRPAHQRDRDADEAEAADEVEDQAVLVAQQDVDRDAAGERAGNERGDDGDAGGRDAAVDRRGRVGADGADFVAEPGAPDRGARGEATEERQQERQVERRVGRGDPEMTQGPQLIAARARCRGTARLSAFICPGFRITWTIR